MNGNEGGAGHVVNQGEVSTLQASVDILKKRRNETMLELARLDQQLTEARALFEKAEKKTAEERAPLIEALSHIEALLRLDGVMGDNRLGDRASTGGESSITDAAAALLETRGVPLHYKEIAELLAQSIVIPGRNPAATLLTRMSRDPRFKRGVARGTYGLSHWKLRGRASRRPKGRHR